MNNIKKVGWRPHEGLYVKGVGTQDIINKLGNQETQVRCDWEVERACGVGVLWASKMESIRQQPSTWFGPLCSESMDLDHSHRGGSESQESVGNPSSTAPCTYLYRTFIPHNTGCPLSYSVSFWKWIILSASTVSYNQYR